MIPLFQTQVVRLASLVFLLLVWMVIPLGSAQAQAPDPSLSFAHLRTCPAGDLDSDIHLRNALGPMSSVDVILDFSNPTVLDSVYFCSGNLDTMVLGTTDLNGDLNISLSMGGAVWGGVRVLADTGGVGGPFEVYASVPLAGVDLNAGSLGPHDHFLGQNYSNEQRERAGVVDCYDDSLAEPIFQLATFDPRLDFDYDGQITFSDAVTYTGHSAGGGRHACPTQPPVAVRDTLHAWINQQTTLVVLKNDFDHDILLGTNGCPVPDLFKLDMLITTGTAGAATISHPDSQLIVYTSALNFTGYDSVEYVLRDWDGDLDTTTVTIMVTDSPDPSMSSVCLAACPLGDQLSYVQLRDAGGLPVPFEEVSLQFTPAAMGSLEFCGVVSAAVHLIGQQDSLSGAGYVLEIREADGVTVVDNGGAIATPSESAASIAGTIASFWSNGSSTATDQGSGWLHIVRTAGEGYFTFWVSDDAGATFVEIPPSKTSNGVTFVAGPHNPSWITLTDGNGVAEFRIRTGGSIAGGVSVFTDDTSPGYDLSVLYPSVPLAGYDLDGDGAVGASDAAIITPFLQSGIYNARMDYDCDLAVGASDAAMFSPHLNGTHSCLGARVGVPGEEIEEIPVATRLRLGPIFPNPFHQQTRVHAVLPEAGLVKLTVYDITGRLIRVLADEFHPEGEFVSVWDGKAEDGRTTASGMYFIKLESSADVRVAKILLLK